MKPPREAKDRIQDLYRPPATGSKEVRLQDYVERPLSFVETVGVLVGTVIVVLSLVYAAIAVLR